MPEFVVTITKEGRLPAGVRSKVSAALLEFAGEKVSIKLTKPKKRRSLNQNAYWFGMLNKYAVPVFRDYGDNWDEFTVHEYVMNELGYRQALPKPDGTVYMARQHSSEFNTKEFEEFMERARAFLLLTHGIEIPLPNEQDDPSKPYHGEAQ